MTDSQEQLPTKVYPPGAIIPLSETGENPNAPVLHLGPYDTCPCCNTEIDSLGNCECRRCDDYA